MGPEYKALMHIAGLPMTLHPLKSLARCDAISGVHIFDLDRTITVRGTYFPFLLYHACRHAPLRLAMLPLVITLMLLHAARLLDRKSLKTAMFAILIGKTRQADLERSCANFVERLLVRGVYPEAVDTIRSIKNSGCSTVLATASYDWMAEAFATRLGIDHVAATKSIKWNGYIVPGIDGENCQGEVKLMKVTVALRSQRLSVDDNIFFYTDHHSDIPLLQNCTNPIAVNPTSRLRKWAARNPHAKIYRWNGKSSARDQVERRA